VSLATGMFIARLALLRLSEEGAEHAEKFLGLPLWIWQTLNLVLFFGVLYYLVAKPLTEAFRKRQMDIEERRLQAEKQRQSVQSLAADIRERTAKVEREIEEIRKQGRTDGEQARAALAARAAEEAERIRKDATEEIDRRLSAAKSELRQSAADLTAASATDILHREITPEDRQRMLTESVSRMKEAG
jgi:F-type H+-transporting ATPase subunit b